MNNVLKHAGARNLKLQFTRSDGHVRMVIADDGAGYDLQEGEQEAGFGIAGMRERARQMDGQLEIMSRPGEGTQVIVEVLDE